MKETEWRYIQEDKITHFLYQKGITIRPILDKEHLKFVIAIYIHGIEKYRFDKLIKDDYKKYKGEITVSQAITKTERYIYDKIIRGEDITHL